MTAPNDATTAALLELIGSQNKALEAQRAAAAKDQEAAVKERAAARNQIARLVKMIEGLTRQLDLLLVKQNKAVRAELARQLEEAAALAAAAAAGLAESESATDSDADSGHEAPPVKPGRNRNEHGRAPKPDHLPRDVTQAKADSCPKCGGDNLLAGDVVVSEAYHYVRAHLRVQRHERTICDCKDCDAHIVPEQPPMPFDRVSCTFAMMAWLCFAKCGLFLPVDRIQRDLVDQGVTIPSSTLTRWWQRGADLLMPIAAEVRLSLLAQTHIRTDGTGLRVVFARVKGSPTKGAARPGETDDLGYLAHRDPIYAQILVFGDDEHAVYYFTETKFAHHTPDFLTMGEDATGEPILWKGTLTADALNSYDQVFADGDRIESGCNAHGLRKFRDHEEKAPLLASAAMGFIDGFYKVEAAAKAQALRGVELLAYRKAHAAPIAERFRRWLDAHVDDLSNTHPVRKAIRYYIKHWKALIRFLSDPLVELDNNWSERALRKVALLRNNSLYAGGVEGAERLCTLFTLINTSRLLGVDPYDYLEWAMTRVVPHSTNRGFKTADLTPAAYKAAQQA